MRFLWQTDSEISGVTIILGPWLCGRANPQSNAAPQTCAAALAFKPPPGGVRGGGQPKPPSSAKSPSVPVPESEMKEAWNAPLPVELGIKGGVTSRWARRGQSTPAKKGCALMASLPSAPGWDPNRSSSSFCSSPFNREAAGGVKDAIAGAERGRCRISLHILVRSRL